MNNTERRGRLTSSNMHLLFKNASRGDGVFSQAALTYFKKKRIEKKINKSLDGATPHNQKTAWGTFMENVIFHHLGMEWKIISKETKTHPDPEFTPHWSGSRDLLVPDIKVGEIKCYWNENAALFADCLMQQDLELFKKEFPAEYWQIVSNCCIEQVPKGEAILYIPYFSEIPEIQEMAADLEGAEQWKYRFIAEGNTDSLPCIPDDNGFYENITRFEFDIPLRDIEALENKVRKAIPYLDVNWKPTEKKKK